MYYYKTDVDTEEQNLQVHEVPGYSIPLVLACNNKIIKIIERVSDCCLAPNAISWQEKVTFDDEVMMMSALY